MTAFESLLELAITEDIGTTGDITSQAIFDRQETHAVIISRHNARLAGLEYARRVFLRIDPSLAVEVIAKDGTDVLPGTTVMSIRGTTRSILMAERIALNFMAYLSGIATETRAHVLIAAAAGKTVILDTRKTLPGFRELAKEAVRLGGGSNHRMGLHDMVLIKDNHIDAAGGIAAALQRVRKLYNTTYQVEIECRTIQDVREALIQGVDYIMLDNMDETACTEALLLRDAEFPTSKTAFEASGDMNPEKLKRFAGLGLDYISIGRLTHSVSATNFSLQIRP